MVNLLSSIPVSAQIVLGALSLTGVVLLVRILIWWVRNVVRHRLPKPFLGEGSNVEWAEQKRFEIAAGGIAYDPETIDVDGRSDVRASDSDSKTESRGVSIGGDGNHSEKNSFGSHNSINEDDLLHSWLSNSSHADDEWAEKLLGDGEPTQRS